MKQSNSYRSPTDQTLKEYVKSNYRSTSSDNMVSGTVVNKLNLAPFSAVDIEQAFGPMITNHKQPLNETGYTLFTGVGLYEDLNGAGPRIPPDLLQLAILPTGSDKLHVFAIPRTYGNPAGAVPPNYGQAPGYQAPGYQVPGHQPNMNQGYWANQGQPRWGCPPEMGTMDLVSIAATIRELLTNKEDPKNMGFS